MVRIYKYMRGLVREGMVTSKQYDVFNSDKISNNLPDKEENPGI